MPISSETHNQTHPLELYIEYDYLPAAQYAEILLVLDRLFNALLPPITKFEYKRLFFNVVDDYSTEHYFLFPVLSIEQVETGQSFTAKFGARGFPYYF